MAFPRPGVPGVRVALILLLALASPAPAEARSNTAKATKSASPGVKPSPALQKARAELAAVKASPAKRRYRHNWERAIHSLERAARGPDTGPALLDAARARYALYRFSAIESDRDAAVRLAKRAAKAGQPEGTALAAAIRKEAGDEPVAVARPSRKAGPAPKAKAAAPAPIPAVAAAAPVAAPREDEALDPALARAVASAPEVPAAPPASAAAPASADAPARVTDIQTWTAADYTRIAIYLSRTVPFDRQEIPADAQHPRRLALDLRPARLEGQGQERSIADALLHRVRTAQNGPETVRVVLDLKGMDSYQAFVLDDPPRLIVDVGAGDGRREAVAKAPTRPPAADEDAEAGRRPIRRIIVDAGHGGHDTGAIGPRGVREKDVTLAMARKLATRLRAQGFEVTLTRSDDRYLKLEERTAIANMSRGDLFVSIHANAHPRRDRSGVETYFLNVTDDKYARRLAARENGALEPTEGDDGLQRILTDLDAKASAGASRTLARKVQHELTVRTRQSEGPVRDLGVKSALFYVLLGARMPAVLVETAFISNRAEEKRLASPAYQELVAEGIAQAVSDFAGTPRLASR